MKIAVFSTKRYDRRFLESANERYGHELTFFEARLASETASLASGFDCVCAFVHDEINSDVLETFADSGVKLIALRCAGFNNVDLYAAHSLEIKVCRVPAYSPFAVAEHAVGLMLTLNRKFHRSYTRIREGNFALDGLLGFDMHGRTVGIIGTGKIGAATTKIMLGFGCDVKAHDPYPSKEVEQLGVPYVSLDDLFRHSDIISLHCPLSPETHHLINRRAIQKMKPGVMLINTSRGALINTGDILEALKSGHVGYLGLDVYEEEEGIFFEDLSDRVIQDDALARLLTFPNVLITSHQAFFTQSALERIADITLENVSVFEKDGTCQNEVTKARRKS